MASFLDQLKMNLQRLPGPGLGGMDWLAQQPKRTPMPGYVGGTETEPGLYIGEGANNPYDQGRRADMLTRAAAADENDRQAPARGAMRKMGQLMKREGGVITPENRKQMMGDLFERGVTPSADALLDDPAAKVTPTRTGSPSQYTLDTLDRTISAVDKVLPDIDSLTAGVGSMLRHIPGSKAADVSADLSSVASNVAFQALQAMRDASKTGGALGQVSERELDLLSAVEGSIRQDQSPANLRKNLNLIKESAQRVKQAAGVQGSPTVPGGGFKILAVEE